MQSKPTLYIIGGPNGAGKTTFAKEYLPNELKCLRFYNSDEIAKGISPFNPAAAQLQAGKILLKNLHSSLEQRETFAIESTLSGKTYAKHLELAKALGYHLVLHFLWLPSADESWLRVKNRVMEGGHSVPKDAVYRRHPRIRDLVINTYSPLVDNWNVWDASQTPAKLIAESGQQKIEYYL